ncbi:GAF domain-containing sensor histidine kinase [Candidatus Nomurabacteria bacterium]|nr:GAF domain-containing sensor histidine kinase [Candidatus Nomurabacteria bacterium]
MLEKFFKPIAAPETKREMLLQRQISIIKEISGILVSGAGLSESLEKVLDLVPSLIENDLNYVGVLILDGVSREEYSFRIVKSTMPIQVEKMLKLFTGLDVADMPYRVKDPQSIFVRSVVNKEIAYTRNLYESFLPLMPNKYADRLDPVISQIVKLLISVPMVVDDECLGVIGIGWRTQSISESDLMLLQTFANQAAVAIYSSRLLENIKNEVSKKEKALNRVKETLRYERDMLDILAHELRTPLTIMKNAVSIEQDEINRTGLDREKLKKFNQIANDALTREVETLDTILAATRIAKDRFENRPEPVDLSKLIEDSIDNHRGLALEKNISIEMEIEEKITLFIDKIALVQIINNLISNAIKYTNIGSVTLLTKTKGNSVYIEIRDTGIGIPKEEIPNLGEKFYRVNSYISSSSAEDNKIIRAGGTGLGLYVVMNLLKTLGGEISFKSVLNKGTTVTIKLPIKASRKRISN